MDSELTYEPAGDQADNGPGAGQQYQTVSDVVMSNVTAAEKDKVRNAFAVSPRSGSVIPATPEAAARARAGKVAAKERYRVAAEQGLITAGQAVALGVITPEDGWRKIVEAQTELALSPDVRGSTQAAALVGKAIGALATEKQAEAGGNTVTVTLSDAAVAQIAAVMAGQLGDD